MVFLILSQIIDQPVIDVPQEPGDFFFKPEFKQDKAAAKNSPCDPLCWVIDSHHVVQIDLFTPAVHSLKKPCSRLGSPPHPTPPV